MKHSKTVNLSLYLSASVRFAAVWIFANRVVCMHAPIDLLIVIEKSAQPLLTTLRSAFSKHSAGHALCFHLHLLWFLVFSLSP